MPLAEGPADDVLACETNWHASLQQAGESERFGVRPIDRRVGSLERRAAPLQSAFELRVHVKIVGKAKQCVVERLEGGPVRVLRRRHGNGGWRFLELQRSAILD